VGVEGGRGEGGGVGADGGAQTPGKHGQQCDGETMRCSEKEVRHGGGNGRVWVREARDNEQRGGSRAVSEGA
jgi:hypothetical protein